MSKRLIGYGYFCHVYETDKKDIVKKVIKPSVNMTDATKYDAYWFFLNLLINNHNIRNNPFFPKIHEYKIVKDQNGFDRRYVLLEKLHKLKKLTKPEVKEITENSLGYYYEYENLDQYMKHLMKIINNPSKSIKNKDFLNACKFLKNDVFNEVKQYHGRVRLDISDYNVMYRKSDKRLVFVDPITSGLRLSKG
jgi:hypothetical protein